MRTFEIHEVQVIGTHGLLVSRAVAASAHVHVPAGIAVAQPAFAAHVDDPAAGVHGVAVLIDGLTEVDHGPRAVVAAQLVGAAGVGAVGALGQPLGLHGSARRRQAEQLGGVVGPARAAVGGLADLAVLAGGRRQRVSGAVGQPAVLLDSDSEQAVAVSGVRIDDGERERKRRCEDTSESAIHVDLPGEEEEFQTHFEITWSEANVPKRDTDHIISRWREIRSP